MTDSLPVPPSRPATGPGGTPPGAAPGGETPENPQAAPFEGLLDAALAAPDDPAAWLQPLPTEAANPFAPLPEGGNELPATDGLPMAWNSLFLINDPAARGAPATAEDPQLILAAVEGEGSDGPLQARVQMLAARAGYGGGEEGGGMLEAAFARRLETASANLASVPTGDAAGAAPRQELSGVGAAATATQPVVTIGGERPLPSAGTIAVPPQHPQWGHALGERMQWMVGQQLQQAEIRLDPPELGSLDVKVVMNKEHATVHFVTHNPQVRDALEAATPRLREMFAEAGLNLGDVNVSQESFQQQAARDGESGHGHAGGGDTIESPAGEEGMTGAGPILRRGDGLLDTYV